MIGYSVNDVYKPYEENPEYSSSISIGKKVFLTALSIHSILNPFIFDNIDNNNLDFNESVTLDSISEKNLSMSFNGEEFIMSTPLMKDTFNQFEKRYESNISEMKDKQDLTNSLLTGIKESLGERLTEKEVLVLLENESNKKVASLLKKIITYIATTTIGGIIGAIITILFNK